MNAHTKVLSLFQAGHVARALAELDAHLAARPDDVEALGLLAQLAMMAADGRRAGDALARALALSPRDPGLLARRAVFEELSGAGQAALATAREALAIDPGEPVAAALLARLLNDRCQPAEAIDVAQACLAQRPQAPHVARALSAALLFQGRASEALAAARQALDGLASDPATIGHLLLASLYDDTLAPEQVSRLHRQVAPSIAPARSALPLAPAAGRRLRIGFYGADFRTHPVGLLALPALEQLDRERFEPICYAHVERPDAVTERTRRLQLAWRDVTALSDDAVLERMRGDRLDVLVDLAGHSHGGRPRVLRGRAAPVQLSWLGYPCTSGLPEVDGLIGDDIVFPSGCESLYGERLRRLPHGLFCLQASDELPPVAPLPAHARGHVTFGSFNHLAKLSERTVELWSRLLQQIPGSRLVLCAIPLLDERTRAFTLARFTARGVDPARIELRPPQPPGLPFLRQYDDVDLALDPLPFSGGATTLDALRQGVPVIARPGAQLHNRMSASLLHHAGLDGFVAEDDAEYLAIASDWCRRLDDLAELRRGLRARLLRAPASDTDRYARAFEQLLVEASR